MLRFILMMVTVPVCILAGLVGAVAGICAELHWPLSEPNFAYMSRWGVGVGILGAVLTALLVVVVPRERLWWVVSLGSGVTLMVSCASLWWTVVSSLG
jgi:hypothetical protein